MGNAHIGLEGKQLDTMAKLIYERGKVSLKELVDYSEEHGIYLSCSEGEYEDRGMIALGFELSISFWSREKVFHNDKTWDFVIKPIIENERQRELVNGHGFGSEEWEEYAEIKWEFGKGVKKLHEENKLPRILSFTT